MKKIFLYSIMPIFEFFDNFDAFEPDSTFSIIWSLILFVFLIINIFFVPLSICFQVGIDNFYKKNPEQKFFFESLPVFSLIMDAIINLNTGFFFQGVLERRKLKIFKNYLINYFVLDFLSLFPFLILYIYDIKIFGMLYLLRVFKLISLIKKLEDYFMFSNKKDYILQLSKLIFLTAFVNHICACLWHLMGVWQLNKGKFI